MVVYMFQEEKSVKLFINGILWSAFLVSLYGILLLMIGQKFLIRYVTYNSGTDIALLGQFLIARRTLSTYGDPNVLSSQLVVFISILLSLVFNGNYKLTFKAFLIFTLALTLLCVYFSSSRAALLGVFAIFMVLAMGRIKKIWLMIPIVIIGYIIFLEPIRKYYEHRIYTTGFTSDLRITTYVPLFFQMALRIPFGVGFGNNLDPDTFMVTPAINIWHGLNSFYLLLVTRIGLQGVAILILMIYLIARYAIVESRFIEDPNIRYFLYGAGYGVLGQQFNFITNNVYMVPGGMLNFWIMCGMLTIGVNMFARKTKHEAIDSSNKL
jgi:hypothetical protein